MLHDYCAYVARDEAVVPFGSAEWKPKFSRKRGTLPAERIGAPKS